MSRRRHLPSTSYLQAMYQRLFDWVVHPVNSSVEMEDCGADSIVIRVLDIYCIKSNELKRPQDLTTLTMISVCTSGERCL